VSYADAEDARLYDAQNPWGPADEFWETIMAMLPAVAP